MLHDAQMSNPARPPRELSSLQLSLSVAPDSFLPPGFDQFAANHRSVDSVQGALFPLDMVQQNAFSVPANLTTDDVLRRGHLAVAVKGKPVPRVRTRVAKTFVNVLYGTLPESGFGALPRVREAMLSKVYCAGGTENTLGRLAMYYPRRGAGPFVEVSYEEAQQALDASGLRLDRTQRWRPLSLDGPECVTVNPRAENGFPVMGTWRTPGAAQMVVGLAKSIRQELEATRVVADWVRQCITERPYLVALRGKAKADYYSQSKVVGGMMRFYNVLPRQIIMIMQQATQVLEGQSRSILHDDEVRTFVGASMTHGGAEALVQALEVQLKDEGAAYVHCGDDSWVVVRRAGRVAMFAMDCSSFDLTQHSAVTRNIHRVVRDELALIDPVAADLWHSFARERLVVVANQQVRLLRHAGPSGMPMQAKVNDMLMEVFLQRLLNGLLDITEAGIAARVATVSAQMGFSVRLEQFGSYDVRTVRDALRQQPFLFVGYYVHILESGMAAAFCDVPRTMSQLPFPSIKWAKTSEELIVLEAMRLGSTVLNFGVPPLELRPFLAKARLLVQQLVQRVIQVHGNVEDPRLKWAVQDNPIGMASEATLAGLAAALARPPEQLWLEERTAAQVVGPEARPLARALRLPHGRAAFPPPTMANDGRPPPTSVHPPRRLRQEDVAGPSRGRRRAAPQEWFGGSAMSTVTGESLADFDEELEEWNDRYASDDSDRSMASYQEDRF